MSTVEITTEVLAEQAYTLAMGQSLRPQDRAAVLKVVGKYEELRLERVQLTAPEEVLMEAHVLRDMVNELRDVAAQYHYHQSLRERLAGVVKKAISIGKSKELMDADMHAELLRLRSEAKAPDGFASWKDAAIHERTLRVKAQQTSGLTPGVQ